MSAHSRALLDVAVSEHRANAARRAIQYRACEAMARKAVPLWKHPGD